MAASTPSRRPRAPRVTSPLVLKIGGELLERHGDLARVAKGIAALSKRAPLVVVHGGGREIDSALSTAGIPNRQVDGLRVTDSQTLDVVVAVLAGAINTRLVAAVRRAGAKPVGLTGADATVVTLRRASRMRSVAGDRVDLGLVGTPVANGAPRLLTELIASGYVPIVACVGATRTGQLLNVNADALASHLAAAVGARRLVIVGGTAGVLDEQGETIEHLSARDALRLVKAGTANRGMVAKLQACCAALKEGVGDVVIADGRKTRLGTLAAPGAPVSTCTQVTA